MASLAAPAAALSPDPLAPHGQIWTSMLDGEHVFVDPTAEIQWEPAPKINWGNTDVEPVTCWPLDYFFALFPMRFLQEVL